MSTKKLHLMAHLMRRAGFGATREELEILSHEDYEATVERMLDTDHPNMMSLDMMRRYNSENSGMIGFIGGAGRWMYRMISTDSPLREKVALFWHGIFATGYSKLSNGKPIDDQIRYDAACPGSSPVLVASADRVVPEAMSGSATKKLHLIKVADEPPNPPAQLALRRARHSDFGAHLHREPRPPTVPGPHRLGACPSGLEILEVP